MIDSNTYLSIRTSNIIGLNLPTKNTEYQSGLENRTLPITASKKYILLPKAKTKHYFEVKEQKKMYS